MTNRTTLEEGSEWKQALINELEAGLKWTQTQLAAAHLSNSSMEEMLEQTKTKLTEERRKHWTLMKKMGEVEERERRLRDELKKVQRANFKFEQDQELDEYMGRTKCLFCRS